MAKKKYLLIVTGAVLIIIFSVLAVKLKSSPNKSSAINRTNPSTNTSSNTPSNTTNQPSSAQANTASVYKDGVFSGSVNSAYYGNVQVQVTIQQGKITDVKYLQYPTEDSTSIYIAKGILPYLKQEVIKAQSANINIYTGATFTSQAFIQSLSAALNKA